MKPEDLSTTFESLHPLENKFLLAFDRSDTLTAKDIMDLSGLDESRLDMTAGWTTSKNLVIEAGESVTTFVSLTETGADYRGKGNPRDPYHRQPARREAVHGQGHPSVLGPRSFRGQLGGRCAEGKERRPDRAGRRA